MTESYRVNPFPRHGAKHCPGCRAEIVWTGQVHNRGGTHLQDDGACQCGAWEQHTDRQNYDGTIYYYTPAPFSTGWEARREA